MFFTLVRGQFLKPAGATSRAYLITDNWDDWGKYRTMFLLLVVDETGIEHRIGSVKIGQRGLSPGNTVELGKRAPSIPDTFDALDDEFFSLGQGEDYYATLNQLNDNLRHRVLSGLRDIAANLEILDLNIGEYVMGESLLRSVHETTVRQRLHRLTRGDARLTEFRFGFTLPHLEGQEVPRMDFVVLPESQPPTNVHVLIGRNGVGKTRCMRQLIMALLGRPAPEGEQSGTLQLTEGPVNWSFAGLVLVSFSAFDDFNLHPQSSDAIGSEQVGLRHRSELPGLAQGGIKSPQDLAKDFRKSLQRCLSGITAQRWLDAVRTLETDELFAEANVGSLLDPAPEDDWKERAEDLFRRLSSGHAVILLTVTRLVELVNEKTLVLIDEPEGHLHPPLLSAFIRCLSSLLFKRNGVAIIATHSPVVLQEVPRTCAWKLRRSRTVSALERPVIETFGENVGVLTREVFALEVTRSGFHQIVSAAVDSGKSYQDILAYFSGQLGGDAKAIAQALISERAGAP